MTFGEFQKELKRIAPDEFNPASHVGIEICLSNGYCQIKYGDKWIASNDCSDPGGWDKALADALVWLEDNVKAKG